jgi:hypothetical protein
MDLYLWAQAQLTLNRFQKQYFGGMNERQETIYSGESDPLFKDRREGRRSRKPDLANTQAVTQKRYPAQQTG